VEPIDQNAVVGHGVSIACQAEGFPIPTVTWKQSIGKSRLLKGGKVTLLPPFPVALREIYYVSLGRGARDENAHSHLISLNAKWIFLIEASCLSISNKSW